MSIFNITLNIETVVIFYDKDRNFTGANLCGHDNIGGYNMMATLNKDYVDTLTLYARYEEQEDKEDGGFTVRFSGFDVKEMSKYR